MQYKIKSKIWIEIDGKILLGEGRIKLLKTIEETGSLSKSAKKLGMSYKKAWNLIDSVNKCTVQPIVVKNIGGAGGGGTTLTIYGKKMVSAFEKINQNCWNYLDKQVDKLPIRE